MERHARRCCVTGLNASRALPEKRKREAEAQNFPAETKRKTTLFHETSGCYKNATIVP